MFHMSNDSHLFRTREQLESDGWKLKGNVFERGDERMLPLYQGIMCGPYDHRVADVVHSPTALKRQNQPSYLTVKDRLNPHRTAFPAYWMAEESVESALEAHSHPWLLGFRDITSTTNERTVLSTLLPLSGVGNKIPLVVGSGPLEYLGVALNSFVLDFAARTKVGGTTLNYFYVMQFPVPAPAILEETAGWDDKPSTADWLRQRLLELTYTAWDMAPFAQDLEDTDSSGRTNPPFIWDDERRSWLRAELDAALFHLYGVERADVEYIMDTFPIVRRKDEVAFGKYRTKERILQIYDALADAIDTGQPYQSVLDPPSGHGPRHPQREETS